jgi:ribosomal protein L21E
MSQGAMVQLGLAGSQARTFCTTFVAPRLPHPRFQGETGQAMGQSGAEMPGRPREMLEDSLFDRAPGS